LGRSESRNRSVEEYAKRRRKSATTRSIFIHFGGPQGHGHFPEKPVSTLWFVRRIFAAGRFFIAPLVARRAMWHSLAVAAQRGLWLSQI